jgi:hypothetical protein
MYQGVERLREIISCIMVIEKSDFFEVAYVLSRRK